MSESNPQGIRPSRLASRRKLGQAIGIEIAVIVAVAAFFLPGGEDLHVFYYPFAGGCLSCGFVPYYAVWVLWPLRFVPEAVVWPFWTAISAGGLLWLARYTRVNPAWLFLSFPFLGQIWLGQIDVVVAFGLAVALLHSNPYARGAGMALALVKPQIAVFALIVLLLDEQPAQRLKVILPPAGMLAASLLVFGPNWPVTWLTDSMNGLPAHVWRSAAGDVWRFGLPLLVVPFMVNSRRDRFVMAITVSALATPFFGTYSYIVFLVFYNAWWATALSYVWIVAYPLMDNQSMRLAWILPVCVLAYLLYATRYQNTVVARYQRWRARSNA